MKHNKTNHRAIKLMLTVVITILSTTLWAQQPVVQQAVVSGGEYHKKDAGSISWSLGETAVSTLAEGEYIITQGFQQSKLTVTAIDKEPSISINIKAYPNPTNNYVFIEVDGEITNLKYEVYTVNGLNIAEKPFDSNPQNIAFGQLNSGVYLIRIQRDNQTIRTLRVVKD
ncbi:MAG: T9SS type A sorting domain-containing protein [Tenuifilaceae bacterium]|nr:T9SS type A sorting domain-containing protein [Tenuifilaceae bacterium]